MVIFVSSIGRSGTRFIANLFDACTDVPSHHLLEPHCHAEIMERAMIGDVPQEIEEKMNIIAEIVSEQGNYMESTPMFLRVLSNSVLEKFDDVKVIQVLRDPMEVARSYVNRESYPSHENRPWRIPLNSPQGRFKFPPKLSPFQENLCDWLENELQFQERRPKFSATTTLYFSDYDDADAMSKTFETLGVAYDRSKLEHHLEAQDLDRNANKEVTEISEEDKIEAIKLIETLAEVGFPTKRFQDHVYQRFWFTETLSMRESKPMTYNRFYSEGGFSAASKEWLETHTDLKEFSGSFKSRKATLLDAGCGDGEWTEVLSEWYEAIGLDLSEDGIALAKKRSREGLDFVCADVNDLDETDQFDVIFCRAPSFLNHETGSPLITQNVSKLLKHCTGRLYYIKYSREPFERWVPSRVFANFDTDSEAAPDSKWYYNDPEKLQAQLSEIAPTEVHIRENYFVAVMDLNSKPENLVTRFLKIFRNK